MLNFTTCRILNEFDKRYLRLFVEWIDDTQFKILLLRPLMVPLSGEMTTTSVNYYSKELSKSNEEYLMDVKNAFSGKDAEIQFYLCEDHFSWKKKKIWTLGKVEVRPISEIETISTLLEQLLKCHEVIQENATRLEKENSYLNDVKVRLTNDVEEMIRMKSNMERELYKRFLLILNAKKQKIRELRDHVKCSDNLEKSVFDAATDQSGDSEEENAEIKKVVRKNAKSEKRKLQNNSEDKNTSKVKRSNVRAYKISVFENDDSPKPSTSKDTSTEHIHSSNSMSSETECEIELRDTDESMQPSKSCLDGTEEELEEDLFSQ